MADVIKMKMSDMDELSNAFNDGSKALYEVKKGVLDIAKMIDDGGLVGDAGTEFSQVLRGSLSKAAENLAKKFTELEHDVRVAKQEMMQADEKAKLNY